MNIFLQGSHFVLREFDEIDIPQITKIASTPGFSFYSLACFYAPHDIIEASAVRFVRQAIDLQKKDALTQKRESYKLAVAEKDAPWRLIGYVSLDELSEAHGNKRDIGYFVDPKRQGHGYATAASSLLLNHFFENFDFEDVHATVHHRNRASLAILKKLGYREIGPIKKLLNGTLERRILFKLYRDDFYKALRPQENKTFQPNFAIVQS